VRGRDIAGRHKRCRLGGSFDVSKVPPLLLAGLDDLLDSQHAGRFRRIAFDLQRQYGRLFGQRDRP
jgi:hypothetical protein